MSWLDDKALTAIMESLVQGLPLPLLLAYLISAFGLAWIVGHAKISFRFRIWLHDKGKPGQYLTELIECPGCFGFWFGGLVGTLIAPWFGIHGLLGRLITSFGISCLTAGGNIALAAWTKLIMLDPR